MKILLTDEQTLKLPVSSPLLQVEWTEADGTTRSQTMTLKIAP